MTFAETFLPEFDQEMSVTRRVLERVPDDRATWKPHAKSFSLAHLAQLVASMPGWIGKTLKEPAIDLAGGPGYSVEPVKTLLERLDKLTRESHDAIASTKDSDLAAPWSLTRGEMVLFTVPRAVAVRMHLSHLVHHRAQLAMYLRLLDVPVPSMYGPTADEPWGAAKT